MLKKPSIVNALERHRERERTEESIFNLVEKKPYPAAYTFLYNEFGNKQKRAPVVLDEPEVGCLKINGCMK